MTTLDVSAIGKEDALVKALVTDLSGGFKEIIFPSNQLEELISPGIAYDGSSFAGINDINASDAILAGAPETLVQVPESIAESEKNEYWVICNILDTSHQTHPNCGRGKLLEIKHHWVKLGTVGAYLWALNPKPFLLLNTTKTM